MATVSFDGVLNALATVFNWGYLLTILFVIFLVIQQRGDPNKTISWILMIVFFPVVGIVLYFLFGKNYRKQKIFSYKGLSDIETIKMFHHAIADEMHILEGIKNQAVRSKQHIIRLLLNNSKAILTRYNRLGILNNGRDTFDEILRELEKAVDHIHVEYYIIEKDRIGTLVRDLLIRKAMEGVKVRVIYDDVGSWNLDRTFLQPMQKAGIEFYPFLPVRFIRFANKINYRNHRKIIVIDGKVGFVGGLNIADRYIEGTGELGAWRDTHLKIEGEAVRSLQLIFLTDWYFVSGSAVKGDNYFPPLEVTEEKLVQITASGPDSDWASIMQVYFSAISTARHRIYISTPYFIPNESILTALKTASLSGVEVRILIPLKSDSRLVYYSTLSFVSELLEAGVRVFFYKKGFNHSKLMMVDGVFCSVGTANMDIRSFDQNFEVNAIVYDREVTHELEKSFLRDLKNSYEFSLEEWEKRHWVNKLKENTARLLSPLM